MQRMVYKKLLRNAIVLFVPFIFALSGLGQTNNTGTTSANFLKIGVDARSLGLAGAAAGMTGNVLSLYWNPAIIGFIPHSELGFMHHRYVQDMAHEFAVISTQISPEWSIALSFSYFNAGTMDKTERISPGEFVQNGTFSASDFSPIITSAYQVQKNLNLGLSIKPIFEAIDTYHGQTLALDFGGLYSINGFGVGVVVRNVGPGLSLNEKAYDLPLIFSLGGSYQFGRFALLSTELEKPSDNSLLAKIGIEVTPVRIFSLRGGYAFGPINHELGGNAGLAAGMGISVQNFTLDYAFNPMGVLGNSHRISLTYSFRKKQQPILDMTVHPAEITPDNDGTDDFCTFLINSQFCQPITKWEMTLADTNQNRVKSWKGSGTNPDKLIWSGENNNGKPVSSGRYTGILTVQCGREHKQLKTTCRVQVVQKEKTVPPPEPIPDRQIEKKTFTIGDILFDLNRATIRPESEFILNNVVEFLASCLNARAIISGHTDDLASNEYNMQLSLARANAVKNYLLRKTQLDPENIQTQGFGETQPVVPNNLETNRQKNRRVEITVFCSDHQGHEVAGYKNPKHENASAKQIQAIIELVQKAAIEYDKYFRTNAGDVKRDALQNAQRTEYQAKTEAEKWGFGLIIKIVTNETSLYEFIAGIEQLKDNIEWRGMYTAWNGQLVDLSELHRGQAVFILYRAQMY